MNKKEIGALGESIACRFMCNKGFEIVSKNYLKPWGELDIIAKRAKKYHFIEVKTVSYETGTKGVSHETSGYRPEENVHPKKLERLARTAQTYLAEHNIDADWQIDVIGVFLNLKDKKAHCRILENVL